MTEPSSSPHNPSPDRRSGRKFRYGDNAGRDDEDYPLSRHEQDMSPEEVEAYLARQIELEAQLNPGGNGPRTAPGSSGKKFQSRTAGEAAVRTTASSANRRHPGSEESSEPSAKPFRRRRPDQDFPELRTLRRWSLISRWWMRSLGEGVYRFITLDWNLEESFAALAAWRPTQQSLWKFSALTGTASILLTLLLFWHYRIRPNAQIQPLVSAEADFSNEETIEPRAPEPLTLVNDSQPDFSDFEKDETPAYPSRLAMNDRTAESRLLDFDDEPIISPTPPAPPEPVVSKPIEPEPMETEFRPPIQVKDQDEFPPRDTAKANASATTIVESTEPEPAPIEEDEWPARRQDPEPVVKQVEEEKPIEKPVPDPVPDLPPTPPVARRPDPPPAAPPAPQRVAISRSGRWADDQQGAAIYSMIIRNLESQELAELEIVETLPEGSKFISASGQGVYDSSSHSVRWVLSSLRGNSQADLSVRVRPVLTQAQNQPRQTSKVQVSDRRGVVDSRSWKVDHMLCPGIETPVPRYAEVVPAGYYQELSDSDYFFGW